MIRTILLWAAILVITVVVVAVGGLTALWIERGGTWFRGEVLTLDIIILLGMAMFACVGLVWLLRLLFRAATNAPR